MKSQNAIYNNITSKYLGIYLTKDVQDLFTKMIE
jgi:hypothetical protein